MPRKAATIASAPMSGGMSAATTPRKTHSDSRNRIGKAISSARARSSETCEPISGPDDVPAAEPHVEALQRRAEAVGRLLLVGVRLELDEDAVAEPSRDTSVGSRVDGPAERRLTAGSRRRAALGVAHPRRGRPVAAGRRRRGARAPRRRSPGRCPSPRSKRVLGAHALRAGVLEVAARARELIRRPARRGPRRPGRTRRRR